jgi:hypothetical protein
MRLVLAGGGALVVALAGLGACGAPTSGESGFDASSSGSDEGGAGGGGSVTCYELVSAGNVTVAPADACTVLATGRPSYPGPVGPVVPRLLASPSCATLCASVQGDDRCAVEAAYVDAYDKTPHPLADAGADADVPDAAAIGCPDFADGGGVTISCYTTGSYQASGCAL